MKLAKILSGCGTAAGDSRIQVRCDHSSGLLRSIRAGYLDLAFVLGNEEAMKEAIFVWPENLVWVRGADFVLDPDAPLPLISSPNLLYPDRLAMAVLENANRKFEIVFTAFDTSARQAAAEAGIGYLVIPRTAARGSLMIEAPGVLPHLPDLNMGIIAREDLDTKTLAPLIAAFEAVLVRET